MSVYRRQGSPFFRYDFQFKGDRFSGSTERTNRREAEAVEREKRAEARREHDAGRRLKAAHMTIDVACGRYWTEVGQHTVAANQTDWSCRWLIDALGADKQIREITDADTATLVAKRRTERADNVMRARKRAKGGKVDAGRYVSAATVNRSVLEPLKRILVRARDIWGEPTKPIRWRDHKLAEPRERVRSMTVDEEAAILAVLPDTYRPLVAFAAVTGVRAAACVSLTWAQVDWRARRVEFTNKGGQVATVPLSDGLLAMLRNMKGDASSERSVFRNERGDPVTYRAYYAAFKTACRRAGVANLRPHDLRHTAATRILARTGNLKLTAKLLNHSDIGTTARYAHVLDEDLRQAMNELPPVAHSSTA